MPAGGDADDQDPQCLIDSRRFSQHMARGNVTAQPRHLLRQRGSRNGQAPKILGVSDPDRVLTTLEAVGTEASLEAVSRWVRRDDNQHGASHALSGRRCAALQRRRLTLTLSLEAHVARCHGGRGRRGQTSLSIGRESGLSRRGEGGGL